MARLLTQTTDYQASWNDISENKTTGELSEAIECIFSGYSPYMDNMVEEIILAIKDGHLKTLENRIVEHFKDDEDLEIRCDKTRTSTNTQEQD